MPAQLVTVFGGTGFLGRRIVRHLHDAGFAVRIASRHPDYLAAVAVIRLAGHEPLDNWAVAEFPYCQKVGKKLLIYVDGLSAQARSTLAMNMTIPFSDIS